MFYSKLRHAPSNSIIDISNHNQNRARSQTRVSSYLSHHHLCSSYSDDSLDKEFIENTKQTVDKLFQQTNFNKILDQIQCTLHPVIEQFRQQIQRKNYLSKQDRFKCMKSCAKFITEVLLNEQWEFDYQITELYHLQQVLDHFLTNPRTNKSVQTNEQLETDMMHLQIDNKKKLSKNSLLSSDERSNLPKQSIDNLTRQKLYHKSVSTAFKKLNDDLQKLNHETPFQSHLSKYHKHHHK
ncbi:unnamed protein product [Adineta steineri]|uniref:Uncharacterized protein n=1 Tax=Adineta steineri TaxID=433720 RepID=A0A814CVM1_9BILA|nr:unnamed protein product [Adineta steineri]CAF3692141.1 unnamed protein product [Adineta steineri]